MNSKNFGASPAKRLTGFLDDVYKPLMHIGFSALWFLSLAGLLLTVSNVKRPLMINVQLLAGVCTLFLVLFFLRVADEIKDADYDKEYNPDRPLVCGRVSYKDLYLFLCGSAIAALAINILLLGWVFAVIIVLDMLYGLFLIYLEKKSPSVTDSMFVNLAVTYPVNVVLSIYIFMFCHKFYQVGVSLNTILALFVFIAAFLHHEIGRKTCWPERVRAGKRHYSAEIGSSNSAILAAAIALFSTFGVFVLLTPWTESGPAYITGAMLFLPLAPAIYGVFTFFASKTKTAPKASDAPMTLFCMGFLFLFYLMIIAHTIATAGIRISTGGALLLVAVCSLSLICA
ncbi:MAG: UbiA family prenyltransferase [Desulfobacteraceae bacterium]|nr:UbiA family prenyltransferase [Desulfobacteraceae bacterium]